VRVFVEVQTYRKFVGGIGYTFLKLSSKLYIKFSGLINKTLIFLRTLLWALVNKFLNEKFSYFQVNQPILPLFHSTEKIFSTFF